MADIRKVEEIYEVEERGMGPYGKNIARIYFKRVDGLMVFDHCDFGFSGRYTYDQWMFLRKVSYAIEELKKQHEEPS